MNALLLVALLAAPSAPALEGVVERAHPGVTSPKLEAMAADLGGKLADCLSEGEVRLDVEARMREAGPS